MKTAIIKILDEVNVKIEGADPLVRRKMVDACRFFVPNARHTPAYKLGRWDGYKNLCTIGGRTYLAMLERVLPILIEAGYHVDIDDQRQDFSFIKFDELKSDSYSHFIWPEGHPFEGQALSLYDHQLDVLNGCGQNLQSVYIAPTAAGKCQPYDSRILTPNGWTTMGDIQKGDFVKCPDGSVSEVIETYYPGSKDVYEITFADGRKVKSCGDHLWPVRNIEWKNSKAGYTRLLTTEQIIEHFGKSKRPLGVPLADFSEDTHDIDLPLDPWLLGFLIGDGNLKNGISFSSADSEIVDRVTGLLHEDYKVIKLAGTYDYGIVFKTEELRRKAHSEVISLKERNPNGSITFNQSFAPANMYTRIINDLGLYGKLSHDKFIPEIYFNASHSQRKELMRGLIDSDGYICHKSPTYSTVSEVLAQDVARLAHSLGGIAKVKHSTNRTYVYEGERRPCRDSYNVVMRFKEPWEMTWLPRKKESCGTSYQYGEHLKLVIERVEKVSNEPVKCIMIDHPDHLYVTDGYVQTHNTIVTAILSDMIGKYGGSLVIVPTKDLVDQTCEEYHNMGLDYGKFYGDEKNVTAQHIVGTWQSLEQARLNTKKQNGKVTIDQVLDGKVGVIVDETHKAKGTVLLDLLCNEMAHIPIRWGLTGTLPEDEIGQCSLECAVGPTSGKIDNRDLQEKGILSKCHIDVLQTVELYEKIGDYHTENKFLTSDRKRIESIVEKLILPKKEGQNALILVDKIPTGKLLEELIPGSIFVHGGTPKDKRKEAYDLAKTNDDITVIATTGVASTGISINRIFKLFMFELGKSYIKIIQTIGRGLRIAKDKDFVNIYDICANTKYSKKHLTVRKKHYRTHGYPHKVNKVEIY
tara:strand:+ start:453 stop:3041 length:2589 start_codon:yes stop_codon:yes gene_type:complete